MIKNNAKKIYLYILIGISDSFTFWTLAKFRLPLAGKALWLALVPRPEAT